MSRVTSALAGLCPPTYMRLKHRPGGSQGRFAPDPEGLTAAGTVLILRIGRRAKKACANTRTTNLSTMRLGRGISVCIAALASAAVLWVPGGASACACGELGGVVVARGHSLYGVPWQIKASPSPPEVPGPRGAVVHFSISSTRGSDSRFYSAICPKQLL